MLKTGITFRVVRSSDGFSNESRVDDRPRKTRRVRLNVIIGIRCASLKRFGQVTAGALIRGSYRV